MKNKEYDAGIFLLLSFIHSCLVYSAIEEMVAKNPSSVFTYEYLLSACDDIADRRCGQCIPMERQLRFDDYALGSVLG